MVFGNLFKSSSSKKIVLSDEAELKKATALLMYKLIRADGVADAMEMIHYKETLRKEFKLEQAELDEIVEQVKVTDQASISVEQLTDEIRKSCGNAKRVKMLEYLWILAFVDDRIDKKESEIINKVAELLYLSDAEVVRAQENAENVLGLGF